MKFASKALPPLKQQLWAARNLSSIPGRELDATRKVVIFSAIQPTGIPHIGNYLGAVREWVNLQNHLQPGAKLIISVADLHALTQPQNKHDLRQNRIEAMAALVAAGLDPKKSTIFFQSDVTAHAELMWILACVASTGYLARMTQWKSKMARSADEVSTGAGSSLTPKLGLFAYPVLQAADILVHGATHVPVGEDQNQHVEFARDCVGSLNSVYGTSLERPSTIVSSGRKIMSLREPHSKMSKSHKDPNSRILLTDSREVVRRKILLAVTDSESQISYDVDKRPGLSNLLDILRSLDNIDITSQELARQFEDSSIKAFKLHVADRISCRLESIREKFFEIMKGQSPNHRMEDVAAAGARIARLNAAGVLYHVQQCTGLR